MTKKIYLHSSELRGRTIVTDVGEEPKPFIRLRESWFHPQGGGQQGDRGRIGPCRVVDTRHAGDGIVDHIVECVAGIAAGDCVDVEVDPGHRLTGARLHSAGHLLADAVVSLRPTFRAVAGHHWIGEARVEFEMEDGAAPAELPMDDLQSRLNELIASDLEFKVTGDPGISRAIKIGEFAPVSCGGTHVQSSGALNGLRVTGIRQKKGRLRVSYEL
jgi:Ser-tRNA(Ala) deacylase AlaX